MMKAYYRDSIMEIDLDKMRHNIRLIRNDLTPNKFMYSVVKGNGYGYGILEVVRISIEEGCNGVKTATLDEGMVVRKHFPDIPILVLGVVRKEDVVDCAKANIRITIPNVDFAEYLSKVELPSELKVHLKVNSGMVEDYSQVNYDIVQVFKVKSKVVHIASYPKGAYLGYANKYQVPREGLYYAVIPIGYADGIDPAHSGCKVRCNNQYGTIVGKICMDQITLEFEEPVAIEDEVVLIDGEDPQINIYQRGKEQGVITVAVLQKFTTRLPKVYYENGEIYKIENAILNQ